MDVWFTADTHFGHKNIIGYCKRPFASLDAMDRTLIRNWNERVKEGDTVIFLGDLCFHNSPGGKTGEGTSKKAADYLSGLNGYKVFIGGNHDGNNSLNTKITALELELAGHKIYCTHNPNDYNPMFPINLCGHVHDDWEIKRYGNSHIINVGVDVWGFRPISIQEILKRLNRFKSEGKE